MTRPSRRDVAPRPALHRLPRLSRPRLSRLLGGAIVALLLAAVVLGGEGLVRVWAMQQELEALERDLARLQADGQRLAEIVERLRNDPAAIEKVAREEFGLVRQGETILKFPSQSR